MTLEVKCSASHAKVPSSIPGKGHVCFREINPLCEFMPRLHIKDPLVSGQDISRAKFRKKEQFGVAKNATKIVSKRIR